MKRWYVVHTHAREELTARRNLVRQGFSVFLPEYRKRRSHARRIEFVVAPLFPRYLFVTMDPEQTRWRAISSTIGVSSLVCHAECPTPVPAGVIEEIQARIDDTGLVRFEPMIPYRRGDAVQVIDGAFAEQIGLFEGISDGNRVILLLEMLGRQVKVKLPRASLAPLA